MKFSLRDRTLRLFRRRDGDSNDQQSVDPRFPPFFPDTTATRHGIVLVRIATWLMAAYAPLYHSGHYQVAAHLTRAGWISCAGVGLTMMGAGIYRACAARIRFYFAERRGEGNPVNAAGDNLNL